MADEKQPIDWVEIERDYRSSPMSVREMARWYGVSEAAIRKRAKAGQWGRENVPDGTQGVRARVPPEIEVVRTPLTAENVAPEAIVGRGRNLVLRLMDELEATTMRTGELEALIVTAVDGQDADRQREVLRQAVSLKTRSDVLKSLTLAAKTLAEAGAPAGKKVERQAAAERVASGNKFAPPAPPKLVVDNGA